VRGFQQSHGLRDDGVCDDATWSTLVEASWELGDRHLYLRSPNLRGDDVADLQARLGRLGFDAGRVDGIFGPDTARALQEFQRNVALTPDGICGYETLRSLQRLATRADVGPSVASVREDEEMRRGSRGLDGKRLVVGHSGGLGALTRSVARQLRLAGASALEVPDPDARVQARMADQFDAELYIGLAAGAPQSYVAYYAVPGFESVGGRRMAERFHAQLSALGVSLDCTPRGMRSPVLRETRMAAVVFELGTASVTPAWSPRIATAAVVATRAWFAGPER